MEFEGLHFEWDDAKARGNLAKHGVAFEEAASVFTDALLMTVPDARHAETEARYFAMGLSRQGRLLAVSFAERGERIRIISARHATRQERQAYER